MAKAIKGNGNPSPKKRGETEEERGVTREKKKVDTNAKDEKARPEESKKKEPNWMKIGFKKGSPGAS